MTVEEWKKKIVNQMKEEEGYNSSFDLTIGILAEILAERDKVYKLYLKEGSEPIVEVKTDRGQVNKRPNPLLRQWQDLNGSALQYIKELGLSPAGLKKIKGEALPERDKGYSLNDFEREFS